MAGGVIDGTPVDAETTNPAFLFANGDDVAFGKIGFNNADSVSGSAVTNIQREGNAIWSFVGGLLNQVKTYVPTWATTFFGGASDSVFTKISAIDAAFTDTGALAARAGRVTISSGAASKSVTFAVALPDADYVVELSLENTLDATPIFLQWAITARLNTGFTASFNAPTDTANYVMHYSIRKAA